MTAIREAIQILSRAHRASDITEAGLALPLLDVVEAELAAVKAARETLRRTFLESAGDLQTGLRIAIREIDRALSASSEPTT